MTAPLHGELIKAITTRTMAAYAAMAFAASVLFVLAATQTGDLASLADSRGLGRDGTGLGFTSIRRYIRPPARVLDP